MRIGVDIDNTLVNTAQAVQSILLAIKNDLNYDISVFEEHSKDIARGIFKKEEVKEFFDTYTSKIISLATIKDQAAEVLMRLKQLNHDIIFITARDEERMKDAQALTLEYFKKNKVIYDDIVFGAFHKVTECLEHDIDFMIDDSYEICESLLLTKTMPLLFHAEHNKDVDTNVKRVYSWLEIESIINEASGDKLKMELASNM